MLKLIFDIIEWVILFFTFAIFGRVILSFAVLFMRPPYPPLLVTVDNFLFRITEPVLAPIRRMLPSYAGFDFSPMAVMIILIIIQYALPN